MNTKSVVLMITFAAVAIALNAVRIPSIIYPGTSFEFCQIPIVVAFILFGVKIGVTVGILNFVGGLALFPLGNGLIVYPMDFVALLLMFTGVFVANRFATRIEAPFTAHKTMIKATALSILFRGGIMPLIDYAFIYYVILGMVLRVNLPEIPILGFMLGSILYNIMLPLYTVPAAYVVAKRVDRYLRTEPSFPEQIMH